MQNICVFCVMAVRIKEEMTRLQQSIEELKMESGDEGDDKKVSITFTAAPSVLIYVSHSNPLCMSVGDESVDRSAALCRQRKAAEDSSAHGEATRTDAGTILI